MNRNGGNLEAFLGESQFEKRIIFDGERFPNVVITTTGAVLATWGSKSYWVRRSTDGGASWEPAIEVAAPGFHGGGATVDERSNHIILFNDIGHPPKGPQKTMGPLDVYRSRDDGRNWEQIDVTIHPDENGNVPSRHMCEHGITLRRGPHAGRLLRPARIYNKTGDIPLCYTSAIYSDDGGLTWHSSSPFPETGTGESAVVELADGRIYHNSRKHFFNTPPGGFLCSRWVAWSHDGGESWQNPELATAIPDGPRYRGEERRGSNFNGHFGMLAGLTRLPVQERDVLIYSNADHAGHERINGTVWASFDGGETWPVKRTAHEGPFAYSSLEAGRPHTPSEGWIYLQYEGGKDDCYEGGWMARFNLAWLLEGKPTGDGDVPDIHD